MVIFSATDLRDEARLLLKMADVHGFVHIAPSGGELLVTDALRYVGISQGGTFPTIYGSNDEVLTEDTAYRRTQYELHRLTKILRDAGFKMCKMRDLLFFSPDEIKIYRNVLEWKKFVTAFSTVTWDDLTSARSLAARLLCHHQTVRWTPEGRQLLLEALRLPDPALTGWPAADILRPRIAEMLRLKDHSGMYETGTLLVARMKAIEDSMVDKTTN